MKRQIIEIDEEKCTGCGDCIPNCPEGALQIIDGKARLISDLFCDGLGACIGNCPEDAISTIEREAEPYDEKIVMENIIKAGPNTIKAHLKHLLDHDQDKFYTQALEVLEEKAIPVPELETEESCSTGSCPGVAAQAFIPTDAPKPQDSPSQSQLRQWPIQLHLLSSIAPYFENADLLISADCAPYAYADFHQRFIQGKIVITLCPKLDHGIDEYVGKLTRIFETQNIKSITIVRMEVPCCGGIEMIVQKALEQAGNTTAVKVQVVSVKGDLL